MTLEENRCTVLSLKTAPGAFEIEKVTLLFEKKKAPTAPLSIHIHDIIIVFFSLYMFYMFSTKAYIKNKASMGIGM